MARGCAARGCAARGCAARGSGERACGEREQREGTWQEGAARGHAARGRALAARKSPRRLGWGHAWGGSAQLRVWGEGKSVGEWRQSGNQRSEKVLR
jgi:hypothetical protein